MELLLLNFCHDFDLKITIYLFIFGVQVLQRSFADMELTLSSPEGANKENNGGGGPLAKVTITDVASQPIDDLESDRKSKQGMLTLWVIIFTVVDVVFYCLNLFYPLELRFSEFIMSFK